MSVEIKFLADEPESVPVIAKWYYDEWGHRIKDNSVDIIAERMRGMLNRDKIPLHVVAMDHNEVVGVAQLKFREMDIYPEKEHWLGGVLVAPKARNSGLAFRLVSKTLELAKEFEVPTLYLQTERLDGGLYARMGWKPIEEAHYNGLHVLVMENKL